MGLEEIVKNFDTIALGPSSLELFAKKELLLQESISVAMPDSILKVIKRIQEGDEECRQLLVRIFRYYGNRWRQSHEGYSKVADQLVEFTLKMQKEHRIVVIDGEWVVEEVAGSLEKFREHPNYEIELSPKKNLLRDYLVKIYSWSYKTGGIIVEGGRRIYSEIGRYILSLQIPDKISNLRQSKSEIKDKIFERFGGKNTQVFVGIVVATAGLISTWLPLGIAGVGLAYMDP